MPPLEGPDKLPTRPAPKRGLAADSSAEAPPPKKKSSARGKSGQWSKACITCRRKKKKCSGDHPCVECKRFKIPCSYTGTELTTSHVGSLVVEAFHILRRKSPEERAEVFEYLSKIYDATLIMSRLRLNEWTEYKQPEPCQRVFEDLELEDRHPFVYAHHRPLEVEQLDRATKRIVEWPGDSLQSLLPGAISELAIYQSLFLTIPDPPPTPTPQYDDPRLRGPFLKPWTNVKISDGLASRALRYYLNTDHPLYGPFHAEPFIQDLVSQGYNYCSSLLVNSLMYWACQNYANIMPSAQSLVGPFCEEAETGWAMERGLPTRLTMAAGVFISLGHLAQGKPDAIDYLKDALAIGSEMGLYKGGSYEIREEQWSPEEANAAAQAAWGVFNTAMMMTTFYFQFNIDYPCSLPCLRIPRDPRRIVQESPNPTTKDAAGNSPKDDAPKDDALKDDAPKDSAETPEWYSVVFGASCKFWSIMHAVAVEYGRDPVARSSKPPSRMFAEFTFQELLSFGDNLPTGLMHQKNSPPCVSLFHMWYHCAVLTICRPFIIPGNVSEHELRTFSTRGARFETVANASVSQLKCLIIDYRMRHESVACSFNWQTGILYLLFAVLNEKSGENADFYLSLCLYGYKKLTYFPIIEQIAGSFLSLMVLNGHVVGAESRSKFNKIWEYIQTKCREAKVRTSAVPDQPKSEEEDIESIHVPLMVDLNLAMTKPEEATAQYMSQSFEIGFLTADLSDVLK